MTPIEIPMEDDLIHTDEHPFCSDGTCGCHEDELLIGEVAAQVEAGLLTFAPSVITSPVTSVAIAVFAALAVGGLIVLVRTTRKG